MESMSLYEMSNVMRNVLDGFCVYDTESGEVIADESNLDDVAIAVVEKIDNCIAYSRGLRSWADYAEEESKRLHNRAKAERDRADRLDRYTLNCVEFLGGKVEAPHVKVSIRRTHAVDVFDEEQVPPEFWVEKTTKSISKKKIRESIEDGTPVPGAGLVENKSLVVK